MKRIKLFDRRSPQRILVILLVGVLTYWGMAEARRWGLFVPQPKGHTPESQVEYSELELKLKALHKPIGRAQRGDWRLSHIEGRQTFKTYLDESPVTPTDKRCKLYVQPLGDFDEKRDRIVDLTAEYLGICYSLPVEVLDPLPLSVIPQGARRVHPQWGDKQLLTSNILSLLKDRLPRDAAAMICLTSEDLWPGDGWNFVFGQASLVWRVGVWSMYRFGDPAHEYDKCLMRTLKTAVHETGHMFSMRHCVAWDCCLCGSNSLPESDRRPLWFCHECTAKLLWATGADPEKRFAGLEEFCRREGLEREADFFAASLKAITG
jgi:archaemetzincin